MLRNNRLLAETRRRLWSLSILEKREMLAADAGAAISSAATSDAGSALVSIDDAGAKTQTSLASTSTGELVLIDSDIAMAAEVMPAILSGAEVVLLDSNQEAIAQISQILANRQNLRAIHLVTHGDAGQIKIGEQSLTLRSIEQNQSQVKDWSKAMVRGGDLLIYGCDVASGEIGAKLIDRLASVTGLDVAASSDRTGHGIVADWEMERVVGQVETASWVGNKLLASMTGHLGIETFATGSMSDESMELEINGQIAGDDVDLPNYTNFADISKLDLNGVAWRRDNWIFLTGNSRRQSGSMFHTSAIPIGANTSFQTAFEFQIGGPFGRTGGSGLAFVLQGSTQGTEAIGGFGGYLGYSGIGNSIAIEFDSERQSWDTRAQSISVLRGGAVETELAGVASPVVLNADRPYFAWIDYDGDAKQLSVYISATNAKPTTAALTTSLDLSTIVTGPVYAGFTAGNFDRPNYHRIGSFTMNLEKPESPIGNPNPAQVVKRNLITGLNQPLAVEWSADGRNLYIAEKEGVIKVVRDGGSVQTVIDISGQVNSFNDRGLIDFALHPDLQNNPYLYLSYTYDPPQVYDNVGNALAGPDGSGNRAGRLTRVTLNAATNYTTVMPNSETILIGANSTWDNFNAFVDSTTDMTQPEGGRTADGQYIPDFINSDSQSHTVGSLVFANDGSLMFSIGDGAGFTRQDNRALRAQRLDNFSGKVLRIDPITGRGLSDNPFYNGDPNSNQSKVYQLGLRNPWRLAYDSQKEQLVIGETGWASFEEINTGGPGANFGWPYYEGRAGVNSQTPFYNTLPVAQQFYASGQGTPPIVSLAHTAGSNTIVLGGYIEDSALGSRYDGGYFYNDLFRGTIRFFKIDSSGQLLENSLFRSDAQFVVDLQEGPDGNLYYVNLVEGTVGRYQLA